MQAEETGDQTLKYVNDLAEAEYGTTLIEALKDQPDDMAALRLARLSGIPLKNRSHITFPPVRDRGRTP
jgi:hypothetical protein